MSKNNKTLGIVLGIFASIFVVGSISAIVSNANDDNKKKPSVNSSNTLSEEVKEPETLQEFLDAQNGDGTNFMKKAADAGFLQYGMDVDAPELDTSKVTNFTNFFTGVIFKEMPTYDYSSAQIIDKMFYSCSGPINNEYIYIDAPNLISATDIFDTAQSGLTLIFESFNLDEAKGYNFLGQSYASYTYECSVSTLIIKNVDESTVYGMLGGSDAFGGLYADKINVYVPDVVYDFMPTANYDQYAGSFIFNIYGDNCLHKLSEYTGTLPGPAVSNVEANNTNSSTMSLRNTSKETGYVLHDGLEDDGTIWEDLQ